MRGGIVGYMGSRENPQKSFEFEITFYLTSTMYVELTLTFLLKNCASIPI